MIRKLLTNLGLGDKSKAIEEEMEILRRKEQRRSGSRSILMMSENNYIVKDWSRSGVFFDASNSNNLALGDKCDFTMKFKLHPNAEDMVSIDLKGKVVRTARQGIAAEFEPLTSEAKRKFDRVLDAMISESFSESQVA